MVDTSDTRPSTSITTPVEKKSPIREFLSIQKNILSMILCWSPMSLMEPWEPMEFLERCLDLDPLRSPGLWINMNSHRFINLCIISVTIGFISVLSEPTAIPKVVSRLYRGRRCSNSGGALWGGSLMIRLLSSVFQSESVMTLSRYGRSKASLVKYIITSDSSQWLPSHNFLNEVSLPCQFRAGKQR